MRDVKIKHGQRLFPEGDGPQPGQYSHLPEEHGNV